MYMVIVALSTITPDAALSFLYSLLPPSLLPPPGGGGREIYTNEI